MRWALLLAASLAVSGCNAAVMTLVGIGIQAAFHVADDGTLIYLQKEQEKHAAPTPAVPAIPAPAAKP